MSPSLSSLSSTTFFFVYFFLTGLSTVHLVYGSPREKLAELVVPSPAVTYIDNGLLDHPMTHWTRITSHPLSKGVSEPDTTVVLLNWSRLSNVIFQASVYCNRSLEDIVEFVFIWNNRPGLKLNYDEHFASTGCRREQLKFFNSPNNILFEARFIGCIRAGSRYCFLQDDDYITRPEILRNIHASVSRAAASTKKDPQPVILLPSHDHLESVLLDVSIFSGEAPFKYINIRFACLGHGTFLLRSQAEYFLDMLTEIGVSEEEKSIADNYFTILRGEKPTTWLTHTLELSEIEVVPFTVGQAGNERNWRHINRAMAYLNSVAIPQVDRHFSNKSRDLQETQIAPCILDTCIVSTNISMLPTYVNDLHVWTPDIQIQAIQSNRLARLGQEGAIWYISHPLSKAVDGDLRTSFRSFGYARKGDTITLSHFLSTLERQINTAELVWLADIETAVIIQKLRFEFSWDGISWTTLQTTPLTCFPVTTFTLSEDSFRQTPTVLSSLAGQKTLPNIPLRNDTTYPELHILECYVSVVLMKGLFRDVRAILTRDINAPWVIYELWTRIPQT